MGKNMKTINDLNEIHDMVAASINTSPFEFWKIPFNKWCSTVEVFLKRQEKKNKKR